MQGMQARSALPFYALRFFLILFVVLISGSVLLFPSSAKAATSKIVEYSTGGDLSVGQSGTFTASCKSGEQMVSGGFYGSAFEGAVSVSANYPSSSNSWTVTDNNIVAPSSVLMSVYVYCLQANYSIGTVIVQAVGSSSGTTITTANCPAGSTLLSGGYSSGGNLSAPNGNGWQSRGANVYAVCATQNLTAAPGVSALFSVPSGTGSIGRGVVQCGSGQLATGGGFESSVAVGSQGLNSDGALAGWIATAAESI